MIQKFKKSCYLLLAGMLTVSCSKEKNTFTIANEASDYFHVKNDDYTIPVWVRGNTERKKIILFVQGGPAGNTMDFATIDYPGWKNTLEKDYAIAYYEQRGTGNGQGNFSLGESVLNTYVDDLHKVALFLKKAYNAEIIMMGHSFGGGLTMRYMISHPTDGVPTKYISLNGPVTTDDTSSDLRWQFRRAFLLNSANIEISRGNNVDKWNEVLDWLAVTPVIEKLEGDEKPYRLMNQWNEYVDALIYVNYGEKDLKLSEYLQIFRTPYNPFPAFLRKDYDGGLGSLILQDEENYMMINRLSEIDKQPILLVTGRFDDICVPEEMMYVYDHIGSPLKHLEIVDEAGHEIFTHQPEKLTQIIKSFIQ